MTTTGILKSRKGLIAFLLFAVCAFFETHAQNEVAIGSTTTKANAILYLKGNGTQGLILPVVNNKSGVTGEAGMIVFDDSDDKVYYHSGTAWVEVGTGTTGGSIANLNLQLSGNQLALRDGNTTLNTVNIATGTPANGTFLMFQGGAWQATTLSGDVDNTNGAIQVNGIKGKSVVGNLPTSVQALVYDPTANSGSGGWTFQPLSTGGGITSILGTAPVNVVNTTTSSSTISIANAGITNTLIAPDAVTTDKIQNATITGADIANTTITGANIQGKTITPDKLAQSGATDGQVMKWNNTLSIWEPQNDAVGAGSVPPLNNGQILIGDGTNNTAALLTGDAGLSGAALTIKDGAITTAKLAANAVDATKLANDAVTSGKILNGTIADADISGTAAIAVTKLAAGTANQVLTIVGTTPTWVTPSVAAQDLSLAGTTLSLSGDATPVTLGGLAILNTVTANEIAADAVTSAKILNGTIGGSDLAGDISISTSSSISAASFSGNGSALTNLNAGNISSGTLGLDRIAQSGATDGQVLKWNNTLSIWQPQNDAVGAGAVPTLNNGQILIGDGTTNTATLLTGDADLSGGALTIKDGAITTAKLAASVVDATKLANDAVTSGKILNGTIADGDISGTAAIAVTKLAAGTANQVLTMVGTVPTWVTPSLATDAQDLTLAGTTLSLTNDATPITLGGLSILNSVTATEIANDAVTSTKILNGTIADADISGTAGIAVTKLAAGTANQVLTMVGTVPTWVTPSLATDAQDLTLAGTTLSLTNDATPITLGGLSILNSVTATEIATDAVTTGKILDGTIADADISGTAAIAVTKLAAGSANQVLTMVGTTPTWQLPVTSTDVTTQTGILQGNGSAISGLVASAGSQYLRRNSGNTAYEFGTLAATDIPNLDATKITSGTLSVVRGGTGASTLTGALFGNGAGAFTAVTHSAGSQYLRRNTANTGYEFGTLSIANADVAAGAAIDGSKINPDFGNQNIQTTNTVNTGGLSASSTITFGALAGAGNRVMITDNTGVIGAIDNASGVLSNDGLGNITWQPSTTGWGLTGNSGTNPGTDFIGTTDLQPLRFATGTGGVERMRISATGNVGIGTTTPGELLSIAGASSMIGLQNTAGGQLWRIASDTDGTLKFVKTSGTTFPPLTLSPTGAIGIYDGVGSVTYGTAGQVLTSGGPGAVPIWSNGGSGWSLTGNGGTVDGTNFIGTTDAVPLNFRVGGIPSGRIDPVNIQANTFFGYSSGSTNSGTLSTGVGYQTLLANTGDNNTAMGSYSMITNTSGFANTAMGGGAMRFNTTGAVNTAIGVNTLYQNTTGNNNTALGGNALFQNTTGAENTAVGTQSMQLNSTGGSNTAVGFYALLQNQASNNVAMGVRALESNSTGTGNTALGYYAGYTTNFSNANTTGSNNTFLGYNSGPASSTQLTNATAIGANALVNASNSLVLGGTGANAVKVGIGTTEPLTDMQIDANTPILRLRSTQSNTLSQSYIEFGHDDGSGGYVSAGSIGDTGAADYLQIFSPNQIVFNSNFSSRFTIGTSGQFGVGPTSDFGTAGQVLTSGGPGAAPSWTTVSGGGSLQGAYDGGNTITGANAIDMTLDNGLVAKGTFGTGTIPATGAGVRMMYYPGKAAFRVGRLFNDAATESQNWDAANVGDDSFAVGQNTMASGLRGFAAGKRSIAAGISSVAMGDGPQANGNYSVATGFFTTATGQEAVAFGRSTIATSRAEVAMGYFNVNSLGNSGSFVGTDPLFQLGNGTSDAARSNAFTILKNGKTSINGSAPVVTLEVKGTDAILLPVGTTAQQPATPVAGHLRYNSSNSAMEYYNGSWQTVSGSGSSLIVNTGTNNLFAGNSVAAVGTNNAVFGNGAGASNDAASDFNVFVGTQAGQNKTTGDLNTMVGYQAGRNSTTSAGNTFIGANAGQSTTSSTNTFVGQSAGLANITGFRNTLLGNFAEVGASGLTNATAIGYKAMVGQDNSLVLGSINGVNTATASTNVGIGTTTPSSALQVVAADSDVGAANSGTIAKGSIRVSGGSTFVALDLGIADDLYFGSYLQSHSPSDQSVNTPLLLNPNGGNIGIGTTAPTALLSVNGTANKPGGGTWATFSDKRVKKDISTFTDGLSLLNQINPVRFKYNGLAGYADDGKEHVGVIAQEVNRVAPYMISTIKKKLNETDKEESELMMYDGSALTYILVNAVKEQQQMIDSLQASVADRNKKIEELEASLSKLKTSTDEMENLRAEIENIKKILGVEANAKKKE